MLKSSLLAAALLALVSAAPSFAATQPGIAAQQDASIELSARKKRCCHGPCTQFKARRAAEKRAAMLKQRANKVASRKHR